MPGVVVTDGTNSLSLKGTPAEVEHEPRTPRLDVPGQVGDTLQSLGRKSRVVRIQRAQLYAGSDVADVADAHRLRTWADAHTKLAVTTLTENLLGCQVTRLRIIESEAKGFICDVEFTEDPTAAGVGLPSQGVGSPYVGEVEVGGE